MDKENIKRVLLLRASQSLLVELFKELEDASFGMVVNGTCSTVLLETKLKEIKKRYVDDDSNKCD